MLRGYGICRNERMSISELYADHNELVVRKSKPDGGLQLVVPVLLRKRTFHMENFPPAARTPVKWSMYDFKGENFLKAHLADDVY